MAKTNPTSFKDLEKESFDGFDFDKTNYKKDNPFNNKNNITSTPDDILIGDFDTISDMGISELIESKITDYYKFSELNGKDINNINFTSRLLRIFYDKFPEEKNDGLYPRLQQEIKKEPEIKTEPKELIFKQEVIVPKVEEKINPPITSKEIKVDGKKEEKFITNTKKENIESQKRKNDLYEENENLILNRPVTTKEEPKKENSILEPKKENIKTEPIKENIKTEPIKEDKKPVLETSSIKKDNITKKVVSIKKVEPEIKKQITKKEEPIKKEKKNEIQKTITQEENKEEDSTIESFNNFLGIEKGNTLITNNEGDLYLNKKIESLPITETKNDKKISEISNKTTIENKINKNNTNTIINPSSSTLIERPLKKETNNIKEDKVSTEVEKVIENKKEVQGVVIEQNKKNIPINESSSSSSSSIDLTQTNELLMGLSDKIDRLTNAILIKTNKILNH